MPVLADSQNSCYNWPDHTDAVTIASNDIDCYFIETTTLTFDSEPTQSTSILDSYYHSPLDWTFTSAAK